jgi:hypothetical protein
MIQSECFFFTEAAYHTVYPKGVWDMLFKPVCYLSAKCNIRSEVTGHPGLQLQCGHEA